LGDAVTCLTLFAGAGGADVGISAAGFTHLACVEGDNNAVATLQAAGFPAVHAWIGGPGPNDQPAFQWSGCPVFLLWASPPCQPYSQAGDKLGAVDPRDGWPATLTTIESVRPTWVIVENVVGCPVAEWSASLAALGYVVSSATLDAADWGLPSHRRRVFIVAGPTGYQWPTPTHYGPQVPWLLRVGKQPWATYKGHTMPTICTTDGTGIGSAASRNALEAMIGKRALTLKECAFLLGFHADYPFQGSSKIRYRQIGNCVAPIMAQVLCQQITQHQRQFA
jgi:site-specific DNA-cytosine methylase